ncbi:MAG: 2-oxoacid:acceptor oxidoreductase family protein [Desulfuromonadales bacterium]|nr:2-oxoacid:acceptor oxidoreductase family protein [Desulfuromonadales bacterium]
MNNLISSVYRIRFHGRGGQGMKTASRILGSAFFLEGLQVQDAPRYGAERRGAPIFAYVRASRTPINERGIIHVPDLVIVADETLLAIPAAGVLHGVTDRTVLLINSAEKAEDLQVRLNFPGKLIAFCAIPEEEGDHGLRHVGVGCAGAAARLTGVISRTSLEGAIREELAPLGDRVVGLNLHLALRSHDLMASYGVIVTPGLATSAVGYLKPDWVDIPFDKARVSAPAVFAPATSDQVMTGLWRTERPVLDRALCKRCSLCAIYCPENAITLNREGFPDIDYQHCKGCLLCVEQCPAHALRAVPEHDEPREATGEERGKGEKRP